MQGLDKSQPRFEEGERPSSCKVDVCWEVSYLRGAKQETRKREHHTMQEGG